MIELPLDLNQKPEKSQTSDRTDPDDVGSVNKFSVRRSVAIIFLSSLALWAILLVLGWSIYR